MAAVYEDESSSVGRRCAIGCETWPDSREYATCPRCGHETKRYSKVNPLAEDEAKRLRLHIEFEDFYEHEHEPDLEIKPEEERLWDDSSGASSN